ncbi:hypothetical protein [Pseudomonas sp. 1928-m]|uniref:hypothetical protein n=1 Tax=Pseudomonas sp. 1928-m TaxID=3033804 RepID=UPI0023DEA146|nr:hypothetical protein [Pseudomonas sp. 1928-m]MDF3196588.1 hypothetical protein [Pseudomonas sp. 1928-m]
MSVIKRIFDVIEGLIKGRDLDCSSERGERVEPVVRLGTVAAVTQKEKADTADDNVGFGKLIVTLSGINQLLLIMSVNMKTYWRRVVAGDTTGKIIPEIKLRGRL